MDRPIARPKQRQREKDRAYITEKVTSVQLASECIKRGSNESVVHVVQPIIGNLRVKAHALHAEETFNAARTGIVKKYCVVSPPCEYK